MNPTSLASPQLGLSGNLSWCYREMRGTRYNRRRRARHPVLDSAASRGTGPHPSRHPPSARQPGEGHRCVVGSSSAPVMRNARACAPMAALRRPSPPPQDASCVCGRFGLHPPSARAGGTCSSQHSNTACRSMVRWCIAVNGGGAGGLAGRATSGVSGSGSSGRSRERSATSGYGESSPVSRSRASPRPAPGPTRPTRSSG